MYVIVAGGGKVGFYLARELLDQGHEVLVIERDSKRAEYIQNDLGNVVMVGMGDEAATLGTGMWALRKDQKKLTPAQRGTLAQIAVVNKPLYKGYLIKEQIREAFKVKGDQGKALMRGVTAWAHRCRIPEFAKLAKTLSRYKDSIVATLGGGPSNGRAEALNAQVNALITRARGFRSATALMNMISFVHGGLCPDSPWT